MTSQESYRKWYERNKERARATKAALMRKYRSENPEKHRKISRECKARLRARLFDMYGRKCALCGFLDLRALSLDHIAQNGNVERREVGERGVYRRALAEYNPSEYRILCMNCQFIERHKHDWSKRIRMGWTQLKIAKELEIGISTVKRLEARSSFIPRVYELAAYYIDEHS